MASLSWRRMTLAITLGEDAQGMNRPLTIR
jgi:hypothetical protein